MDILSGLAGVNYLAVLVATIFSFVLGFAWYGPSMFGKQWMKGAGLTEEDAKKGNMPKIMGGSFVMTFISATVLALLFGGAGMMQGVQMGLILGVGLVVTQAIMGGLYEQKSAEYLWINAGYTIILFAVMGAIVGAW